MPNLEHHNKIRYIGILISYLFPNALMHPCLESGETDTRLFFFSFYPLFLDLGFDFKHGVFKLFSLDWGFFFFWECVSYDYLIQEFGEH